MNSMRRLSPKVTMNFWHFERCTKYRYKMMQRLEIKNLVQAAIRKAAHENGIVFRVLKALPEHVHSIATLPNGMTDSQALALLKGRLSYNSGQIILSIVVRYYTLQHFKKGSVNRKV